MRAAAVAIVALAATACPASASAAEWLAGDLHVHTTYSHDSYGGPSDDNTGPDEWYTLGHSVQGQFTVGNARALDYLAITDHDDIRSQSDPGFGAFGILPVPGYESSLRGHAQMLGARRLYPRGDRSVATVGALAATLRRAGGAFQVNHPAEGSTSFPDDQDWEYAYSVLPDTVEVWNISRLYQPPFPSASSNDDAVRYWERWLDRGFRVTATGGSDNHWVSTTAAQGVGQPTTWVFARERSVAGVLAGLREGRTFISHQPPGLGGPRLFLEGDGDGNGSYEAIVGDRVRPGSVLRVRATGAAGSFLRVVTNGSRQAFRPPSVGSNAFEQRFRLPRSATWARAELFDPDLADERGVVCDDPFGSETTYCRNLLLVTAMTSAIYLGDPPVSAQRPRGRARLRTSRRGCVRRALRAWVRGVAIRRVTFYVDGRRVRSVRRPDRRGRFAVRVPARGLRAGRHRVAARVRFFAASATAPRVLRSRFSVCRARADRRGVPRYTG